MFKKFLVLVALVAVCLIPAIAGDYTHPVGKVTVTIPDEWKVTGDENVLTADAPNDAGVYLILQVVNVEEADKAIAAATEVITAKLGEVKMGTESSMEINGLKTFGFDYTAEEGKISGAFAVVVTPSNKFLLLYYFGTTEAEKALEPELINIVTSIRPAVE